MRRSPLAASLLVILTSAFAASVSSYNGTSATCDVAGSDFKTGNDLSAPKDRWSSVGDRLAVNLIAIIQMQGKLEELEEKLERARKIDHKRIYGEIEARALALKEPACPSHQFECLPRAGECVYDLFVCDGRRDCVNGYDEDEEVCSTSPVLAGKTYFGWTRWTNCEIREDHGMNITIIAYRIRKYSTSLVWLKALIESRFREGGRQVSSIHSAKGHYKFANREMVLLGEDSGSNYASFCRFNKGNYKVAECDLVRMASLDHCAKIHLVLDE